MTILKAVVSHTQNRGSGINRFYYHSALENPSLEDFVAGLLDQVINRLLIVAVDELVLKTVYAENLDTGEAFISDLEDANGQQIGDAAPSYNTWTFHLQPHLTHTIKRGRKAFPGVGEFQTAGDIPGAGADAMLNYLGEGLSMAIEVNEVLFTPMLVRFSDPPNSRYTYAISIASAVFRHISTQNSRKNFTGSGSSFSGLAGAVRRENPYGYDPGYRFLDEKDGQPLSTVKVINAIPSSRTEVVR
jgi:hypothetical protein